MGMNSSFVSGLQDELQSFISMFEPITLQQAITLGKIQEKTLEALARKFRPFSRVANPNTNPNSQAVLKSPSGDNQKPPITKEKGLCYNCDEPFTYGHKCKQKVSYMILTDEQ